MTRTTVSLLASGLFAAAMTFQMGCSSSQSTESADSSTKGDAVQAEPTPAVAYNPHVGMTKDEAVKMYQGEPDHKSTNSDGTETWWYLLNAGQRWIPYNFGYRAEYDILYFGKDGTVTKIEHQE